MSDNTKMPMTERWKIILDRIKECYDVCEAKGATMPTEQNLANLPDCINSIP